MRIMDEKHIRNTLGTKISFREKFKLFPLVFLKDLLVS